MSLSVTLPEKLEQFLHTQASRLGVPVETELLLKLQNAFPPEQTREYRDLCQRSDGGTLTKTERRRLLELIEERDLQNAERLEGLGELARLHGVSLREVMAQLGIQPE